MYTYKLATNGVIRSDGANIPADIDNTDYANYLIWLSDINNIPEPMYVIPYTDIFNTYIDCVRTVREVLLNRLAGIGLAALIKNDTTTMQAISDCRTSLLNITKLEVVVTAVNLDDLKTAIAASYVDIVNNTPNSFKKIYQGINF
jgi:hypothetical protein